MDHTAKLDELKRQADDIARKFAEVTTKMQDLGEVQVLISFEQIASRIAAKAPLKAQSSENLLLGSVRV